MMACTNIIVLKELAMLICWSRKPITHFQKQGIYIWIKIDNKIAEIMKKNDFW